MADTIFGKIIRREIPANIVYEDEDCLAFRDVNPQAPTHLLAITTQAIPSLAAVTDADSQLLGHLVRVATRLAVEQGLEAGYRLVVNCGTDGGQTVDHLHVHLLGGRHLGWPPG